MVWAKEEDGGDRMMFCDAQDEFMEKLVPLVHRHIVIEKVLYYRVKTIDYFMARTHSEQKCPAKVFQMVAALLLGLTGRQ